MRDYRIFGAASIAELESDMAKAYRADWEPQGGPFWDAESRKWCQAMTRPATTTKPGEVKLKEPKLVK